MKTIFLFLALTGTLVSNAEPNYLPKIDTSPTSVQLLDGEEKIGRLIIFDGSEIRLSYQVDGREKSFRLHPIEVGYYLNRDAAQNCLSQACSPTEILEKIYADSEQFIHRYNQKVFPSFLHPSRRFIRRAENPELFAMIQALAEEVPSNHRASSFPERPESLVRTKLIPVDQTISYQAAIKIRRSSGRWERYGKLIGEHKVIRQSERKEGAREIVSLSREQLEQFIPKPAYASRHAKLVSGVTYPVSRTNPGRGRNIDGTFTLYHSTYVLSESKQIVE